MEHKITAIFSTILLLSLVILVILIHENISFIHHLEGYNMSLLKKGDKT